MLLAIETSCDETAVCLMDLKAALQSEASLGSFLLEETISSQVKTHMPYGGIVPELASREHLRNLPLLVAEVLRGREPQAIAVTQGPGLKGCLLVGLSFAKAFALGRGIPLIPVNHLEGHLLSAELLEEPPAYPALALIVSGGHTFLALVRSFRDYEILANTRDDAAGEAFDKTATLLGLPYPGGPSLSRLARKGDRLRYSFPRGMPADPKSFSFSGLKTAVARTIREELQGRDRRQEVVANLAASTEEAIVGALLDKTRLALEQYRVKSLILAGGVAANLYLREQAHLLAKSFNIGLFVPPPKWCTDNAAMIAAVAVSEIRRNKDRFGAWSATKSLGPDAPFDLGPRPRFPIHEL